MMKINVVFVSLIICMGITISIAGPTRSINNDYLQLSVNRRFGLFTLATANQHPAGAGHNVLFGGTYKQASTTYFSIHSYETGNTYVNSLMGKNGTFIKPVSRADIFNGWSFTYRVNNDTDNFVVINTIQLIGNSFDRTHVVWHIRVKNVAPHPLNVGVRVLLDYNVDEDDGPTIATVDHNSGRYLTARSWKNNEINFREYSMEANKPQLAYYEILGEANGPADWNMKRSSAGEPDKITFGGWNELQYYPFKYNAGNGSYTQQNITGQPSIDDDSCVLLYWGARQSTAYSIPSGGISHFVTSIGLGHLDSPVDLFQECYDNYTCTYDYLATKDAWTGECISIPIDYACDDHNPCTEDKCDQINYGEPDINGCVHIWKDCSDQVACTMDWCNVTDGQCVHEKDACDDYIDCTIDSCSDLIKDCDNKPDDDFCQPIVTDLCHTYYCDPLTGCERKPIKCDDDISCTVDTCDPTHGCQFAPLNDNCDDHNSCTEDVCEAATVGGCVNYPKNERCDDFNGCTHDYCDDVEGCVFEAVDCKDPDMACTLDICLNGTCVHIAEDKLCDDYNNCTIDACDCKFGGCLNTPADDLCDDDQFCTDEYCDELEGCVFKDHVCDDQIYCTEDSCDPYYQECIYSTANEETRCDDEIDCTIDVCSIELGRCDHIANHSWCDDGDDCTHDYCDVGIGKCNHIPLVCNDQIHCTDDQCINGTCRFTPNNTNCDDNIHCTVDTCSLLIGNCMNVPTNALCDDEVDCTKDVCNGTHCLNYAIDKLCEDEIPCTRNWCNETGCAMELDHAICDDEIDCTIDYCDPYFGCRYVLNHTECADSYACTEHVCDQHEGCQVTLHHDRCEDHINCTVDTCTETGCDNDPQSRLCDDGIGCTIDVCDNVYFNTCIHTAHHQFCSDKRNCSTESCDVILGCVINDTSCPVDEDCEHCVNCKSTRSRIVVNDLEDGSGDFVLKTRFLSTDNFTVASPVNGLVENVLLKGSGQLVVGFEEVLDADDGLVIGSDSSFKLSPTQNSLAQKDCNQINRGSVVLVKESDGGKDLIDQLYVCLKLENEYKWTLLNTQRSPDPHDSQSGWVNPTPNK